MKILVIKLSALGDIVHAVPGITYLKRCIPEAEIDWLLEERYYDLLSYHKSIDRILTVDTKHWRKSVDFPNTMREFRGVFKTIWSKSYDIVMDLQGNLKSGIFTILSKVPVRYGWPAKESQEALNLLASNRRVSTRKVISIREKYIDFVRTVISDRGVSTAGDKEKQFFESSVSTINFFTESDRQKQYRYLKKIGWNEEPLIGIIIGTTWLTKELHPRRWIELIDKIQSYGLGRTLVIWGNTKELTLSEKIAAECNTKPFIWKGGNLKDLMAVLSLTSVAIGPDTGPVHLADLLGIPTISFYRSTSAERNRPLSALSRAIQAPPSCSPCLRKKCTFNETCSLSISSSSIMDNLRELLKITSM